MFSNDIMIRSLNKLNLRIIQRTCYTFSMDRNLKPVSHVIFDVDGLLLDSENIYFEVTKKLAAEYGIEYTWEIKSKLMGGTYKDSAANILKHLQLPLTVTDYMKRVQKEHAKLLPNCVLLPGVDRLVRHLHKQNIPIAIASSASEISFKTKATNHQEFFSLFDHSVFASTDPEVPRGKPAPDVFLICANRFSDSPDPSKCLVFEDSPNGVEGAVAAGMQVVMVPDPKMNAIYREKATLALDSLTEFKPELFGLPSFDENVTK